MSFYIRSFHRNASAYQISAKYGLDIWGKVFRFNKNVKLFKYLYYTKKYRLLGGKTYSYKVYIKPDLNALRRGSYKRSKVASFRVPRRFNNNRFVAYRKRKIALEFFGRLSHKTFYGLYDRIKVHGNSTSWLDYLFQVLELRPGMVFFRVGFYVDNLVSMGLQRHGHYSKNGFPVRSGFNYCHVGDFVIMPYAMWPIETVVRSIFRRNFRVCDYLLFSFFVPVVVVLRRPQFFEYYYSFPLDFFNFQKKYPPYLRIARKR